MVSGPSAGAIDRTSPVHNLHDTAVPHLRRHSLSKPPPSGPRSDITGINRDARVNTPNRDAGKGSAKELDEADKLSIGLPDEGENAPE